MVLERMVLGTSLKGERFRTGAEGGRRPNSNRNSNRNSNVSARAIPLAPARHPPDPDLLPLPYFAFPIQW